MGKVVIMALNYTSCHYHPNKMAVTVCERCRRPICLEDKRVYRKKHPRGGGQYRSYYYTTHDFCILCNASQLRADANPFAFLIFIPFLLIFFIFFGGTAGFIGGGGLFLSMFVLFFIVFIIIVLGSTLSARNKAESAENEAMNFKSNLYSRSDNTSRPSFSYHKSNEVPDSYEDMYGQRSKSEIKNSPDLFSIVCFECGAHINLEDKYCQNCGDSTHDELINYYKVNN